MESVEVTKEAVTGMSAPTFYYAEVRPKAVVDMKRSFNLFSLLQEASEESGESQEDLKRAAA